MDVFSADWLGICRRIVAAQRPIFDEARGHRGAHRLRGRRRGRRPHPGDRPPLRGRRLRRARAAGRARAPPSSPSPRSAARSASATAATARVVIDPIDGSLNARRTLPSHSLSIAVASGPSMADVEFGYVYDFGAGEEFVAAPRRGRDARRRADRGRRRPREARAARARVGRAASGRCRPLEALAGKVYRLRVVGSIAITAAYVAAGRFDAMLSLRPCRSVDAAAAQLIVREAGGLVAFGDARARARPTLGLDARYPIAAAAGERGLAIVRAASARRIAVTARGRRFKNVCSRRTYVRYTRELPRQATQDSEGIHLHGNAEQTQQISTSAKTGATEAKIGRQAGEIRRQAGRRRREEPGPGRRRGRRRRPRRRRPQRHRPRRRAGRAVHRPHQRREAAQVLPHRAAPHA